MSSYPPPAPDSEPEKPSDEYWSGPEVSIAVVIAEILGLASMPYVATVVDRVRRALPPLSNVVAILPALPMLAWHTVRYCPEPGEQRRGERR